MTLVEVMVAAGLLTLVLGVFVSMLIQSLRGWGTGISGGASTSKGTIAIQRLANDVRDGKSAKVVSGVLVVTFPVKITDSASQKTMYNLSADDTATRSYYVSNGNLVRTVGSNTTVLCRGVKEVRFSAFGGTITITTLTGRDEEGMHVAEEKLTGSIALRNFKS
jgi:hypothetical protein